MTSVRVEPSRALAKLGRVRGGIPGMAHVVAVEAVQGVARIMAMQPHQDTRRWSRAWVQAAHDVGARAVPVPAVQRSRYWRDLYVAVKRFRDQQRELVHEIEIDLAIMAPKSAPSDGNALAVYQHNSRGLYAKKMRALARAKERLRKAQVMLEAIGSDPTAIVLHAGKGAVFGAQRGSTRPPQVVTKIYGGAGGIVSDIRGALVRLENREAHARVVESQYRVLATVKKALGPLVLKGAAKKAVDLARRAARAS